MNSLGSLSGSGQFLKSAVSLAGDCHPKFKHLEFFKITGTATSIKQQHTVFHFINFVQLRTVAQCLSESASEELIHKLMESGLFFSVILWISSLLLNMF